MFTIRQAVPDDLGRIRRFYAGWNYHGEVTADAVGFLAESSGDLVGLLRLEPEGGTTLLRGMRVQPAYQRQSVGTALLGVVADYLGNTACYCVPYAHLVGFYGQVGFVEVKVNDAPEFLRTRVAEYRGRGLDVLVMQRAPQSGMLRPATVADLREVASWIGSPRDCELWAGWRVSFPINFDALPVAISFTDTNAFGLTVDDRLVAFGQLVRKDTCRGHLARLIVDPLRRGNGYGELLVQALLERARGESLERVSLNVDGSNLPAISLYLKIGFRDVPRPTDEPESAGSRYMEVAA